MVIIDESIRVREGPVMVRVGPVQCVLRIGKTIFFFQERFLFEVSVLPPVSVHCDAHVGAIFPEDFGRFWELRDLLGVTIVFMVG